MEDFRRAELPFIQHILDWDKFITMQLSGEERKGMLLSTEEWYNPI